MVTFTHYGDPVSLMGVFLHYKISFHLTLLTLALDFKQCILEICLFATYVRDTEPGLRINKPTFQ